MAAKKCQKCGKANPRFFTHCVDCGAKLPEDTQNAGKTGTYLKIGLVIVVIAILAVFVIFPAIRYSHTFGQDLSETVSAKSAEESRSVAEYPLNQPVGNKDLRITVRSARDGQNTYNLNKFFIVSVYLENNRTEGNIQISNNDFELIDAEGLRYTPYGIGSKVMYDLSPAEGNAAELTFVIPQSAVGKKVRFTFAESTSLAGNRQVLTFLI